MRLSIVVPAHDEEATIGSTLAYCRAHVRPDELLVANVGSVDRTGEIARRYAEVLTLEATRGAALNQAAAQSTGDVLLFLHADTLPPPGAADLIAAALTNPAVVGGAFRLRLDDPSWLARLISCGVNVRSAWLGTFFGDQGLFVRRETFAEIGGYRDWSVMEDLEILARLRAHGRLVLLNAEVITSARRHRRSGWVKTLATVWAICLLFRLGVPSQAMLRLYQPRR
ncbi:MAG: TIGR04283 family arsenosugar biosynthesis glycosyltransferase [Chloroflexi bacterium]|nr:TIGR04283 family arsenosugar biosynthesis glycosyltransferase [Chloroflexota bacterium]